MALDDPSDMEPRVPPPSRDPLYALLTPPGEGAIATILLDGDGIGVKLGALFRSKRPLVLKGPGPPVLGKIVDQKGGILDEAIVAPLAREQTESGLEGAELSCHGGLGAYDGVRLALEAAGVRPARPWELAARAHRAGRLALPELEARMRLTRAETERQARLVLGYRGAQERWERWGLEAALGMRQRDVGWREQVHRAVQADLQAVPVALRLLQTHRVVIAGPANVGKSTLSNFLLRGEYSIVSEIPGTTRDRLERPASWRGLSVRLSDSAGLRGAGSSDVEREGQDRALQAAAHADLVLIVVDGSRPPSGTEAEAVVRLAELAALGAARADGRDSPPIRVLVLNKADGGTHADARALAASIGLQPHVVSALHGDGMEALERGVETLLLGAAELPESGVPFTVRQQRRLQTLKAGLEEGLDGSDLIGHIRALVGTRPNEEELAVVFAEGVGT